GRLVAVLGRVAAEDGSDGSGIPRRRAISPSSARRSCVFPAYGRALAIAVVAAVAIAAAVCVLGRAMPLPALVAIATTITCAPGVWAALRWAARRGAPGAAAACIAGLTAGPAVALL